MRLFPLWLCCFLGLITSAAGQFQNPGVFSVRDNGYLFEWIPSENADVQVLDGKVKLVVPESKMSWNGKNRCRRFLLGDLYDNPVPEPEAAQLLGSGMKLPPGNYAFRVIYVNAPDFAQLKANMWQLMGQGSGGADDNSAMMETIYLSVTDGKPVGAGIAVPADLLRASWLPHYQLLPYDLKLPADKGFGVTRYVAGVPKDRILKKATHFQYIYNWLDRVPHNRKWKNIQVYDGKGQMQQPDWIVRNSIIDKGFITIAELAENYGNLEGDCPRCYQKAEEVFKGLYGRYQRELGVRSPAETRLYDDYFGALYGYGLEMNLNMPPAALRRGLRSVENAQARYTDGGWPRSGYFTNGAYAYRNFRLAGYLGNLFNTINEGGVYKNLYNLEKVNLAVPDRMLLKNGWAAGEALGIDRVTGAGTFQRLRLGNGDILRLTVNDWPIHTMMGESFFQLLLGNDYVLWNSNIPMSTNPNDFSVSWYGGKDDWKTKWQPRGKPAEIYQEGKPSHPKPGKGPEGSVFPEMSLQGETGAFVGAWLYSQISSVSDRVSKSVRYCNFSVNGKSYRPSGGSKGDRSLSSRVSQNPGQDWIVTAFENQYPICICTEGKNGKAVIYQNPGTGLTGAQEISVENGLKAQVTGNRLQVFYVD
ncbi:hypothetical protein [Ravibacter arvi]|uniref:hypothetical protein n=1 Tax=Ravibacter arvi TaxID=2051041 RepID=UPI0031E8649C